jgi:ribosome maturation factor RimP
MYQDIPEELRRLVEPVVAAHGLELVDAHYGRGPGRGRLQVVLDTTSGDGRVDVEQCARVSRELGHTLDALAAIDGPYVLEVTSPGVDRILAREIDFERAVGRRVELETREPLAGRRRFRGELLGFADGSARLATESGPAAIPFARIARARALPPQPAGRDGE